MQAILLSKKKLRSTLLDYRRIISREEWNTRNSQVLEKLKEMVVAHPVQSVHVFLPIKRNREPDVFPLLPWLWDKGISTLTSKTDFKTRQMTHFQINRLSEYHENLLGIPEPTASEEVELLKLDMILVPLVIADKNGNRIGYGGGFYDRLLAENNIQKVGLCLSPLLDKIIQSDEWDIPLDQIITPQYTWQPHH